jgi:hypothetical protein
MHSFHKYPVTPLPLCMWQNSKRIPKFIVTCKLMHLFTRMSRKIIIIFSALHSIQLKTKQNILSNQPCMKEHEIIDDQKMKWKRKQGEKGYVFQAAEK